MSLRPNQIAVADYPVATKPVLGYEMQLYVSPKPYTKPGTIGIVAPNSGTYTTNVADAALLSQTPQEIMAVLDVDADVGGAAPSDLVLHFAGTDANGNPMTGTATFTPPAWANDQSRSFPRGWSAEVIPSTNGAKWKTIGLSGVTSDAALASTPQILLIGVPSLDYSDTGTFTKISTKTKLDWDPAVPMPTAVQDGRRKGAYIKKGIIDVGTLNITAKIPSEADGLARYNGTRLTGWVITKKEDQLVTQHLFFCGLVMGAKGTSAEGDEPVTLDTPNSLYEVFAMIVAQ